MVNFLISSCFLFINSISGSIIKDAHNIKNIGEVKVLVLKSKGLVKRIRMFKEGRTESNTCLIPGYRIHSAHPCLFYWTLLHQLQKIYHRHKLSYFSSLLFNNNS